MRSLVLMSDGEVSRALARDDAVNLYLEEPAEIVRRLSEELDVQKINAKVLDDAIEIHRGMHKCHMVYEFAVKLSEGLEMKEYALNMADGRGFLGHGIRIAKGMGNEAKAIELYLRALKSGSSRFAAHCAEEFGDKETAADLYEKSGSFLEAANMAYEAGDVKRAAGLLVMGNFDSRAVKLYREAGDEESADALYRCRLKGYAAAGSRGDRYSKSLTLARETGNGKDKIKFGIMKMFAP